MKDAKTILKTHNIKQTNPRLWVLEYLLGNQNHPTAEAIILDLKRNLPLVNKATVYNCLKLFVEKGVIKEIAFHDGLATRYDSHTAPHHHFYNEETGVLTDLHLKAVNLSLQLPNFYEVGSVEVVVRGKVKKNKASKP